MAEVAAALGTANYIAGEWRQSRSGRTYERGNPWRPSEVVGEFPRSDADDVGEAVAAAERAWPAWSRTPAVQRCAFLARAAGAIEAHVEDIAQDMTREMGKPLREARLEAARAAAIFRYFSVRPTRAGARRD